MSRKRGITVVTYVGPLASQEPPRGMRVSTKNAPSRRKSSRLPTPQKAIRLRCLDCSETRGEILRCEFGPGSHDPCTLWPFRMGHARQAGRGSRLKAIRRYCVGSCCRGQRREVRLCPTTDCVLWRYRFGKRPSRDHDGE